MTCIENAQKWVAFSRVVRFGVFEADLEAGELRKHGLRLKVSGQPFEILSLLQRPGNVVTCDELRAKLRPADTFVDFDHGLNAAINKLRESLGESADKPRFIETLPRRGYRFIAPLKETKIGSGWIPDLTRCARRTSFPKAAAPHELPLLKSNFNFSGGAVPKACTFGTRR